MAKQLIETIELTSSAASITFSDIPQTYTDLQIVLSARSDRSNELTDPGYMTFNSNTSNIYSLKSLRGTGSTVGSDDGSPTVDKFDRLDIPGPLMTSNTFGNSSIYISNYTQAQTKTASVDTVTENNATYSELRINAYLWNDTAAITSITFNPIGNFVTGTVASLYGWTAGNDGITTVT